MIERWVKVKGEWVMIVFTEDKTFVDGNDCEFMQKGESIGPD